MIHDKKIKKEASIYADKVAELKGFDDSKPQHLAYCEGNADGFIAGVKWAINEFKNELWHSVDEEPKLYDVYLVKTDSECIDMCEFNPREGWANYSIGNVVQWLDIKDILPKKGDKE